MSIRRWSPMMVWFLLCLVSAPIAQASAPPHGRYEIVRRERHASGDILYVRIGLHTELPHLHPLLAPGVTDDDVILANPGMVMYVCGHTDHSPRTWSYDPRHWDNCAPGARHHLWLASGSLYRLPAEHVYTPEELLTTSQEHNAALEAALTEERQQHAQALALRERELQTQADGALQQERADRALERASISASAQRQTASAREESRRAIAFWFLIFLILALTVSLSSAAGLRFIHARAERRLEDDGNARLVEQQEESSRAEQQARAMWSQERHKLQRRSRRLRQLADRATVRIKQLNAQLMNALRLVEEQERAIAGFTSEKTLFALERDELKQEREHARVLPHLHERCAQTYHALQAALAEKVRLSLSAEAEGDAITQKLWNENYTASEEAARQLSAENERANEAFLQAFHGVTGIRLEESLFDLLHKLETSREDCLRHHELLQKSNATNVELQQRLHRAETDLAKTIRNTETLQRLLDNALQEPHEVGHSHDLLDTFRVALRGMIRLGDQPGSSVRLDQPTFINLLHFMTEVRAVCPVCAEAGGEEKPRLVINMWRHWKDHHGALPPPSGRTLVPQTT